MYKSKLRLIAFSSCFFTLCFLFIGKSVLKEIRTMAMVQALNASSRLTDNAKNEVLMYGDSGFVGNSRVFARYLNDGSISISGHNRSEYFQWKKISDFTLPPGTYTFTGLSGIDPESVQLQLHYAEGDSFKWHFLWDEDIQFTIEEAKNAELYIRIFPGATVDVVAKPAVYKDE